MFNNFDHFKKATTLLLQEIKQKPSMKINEFRESLLKKTDYGSIENYKKSVDTESLKISTQVKNNEFSTKEDFVELLTSSAVLVIGAKFVNMCHSYNGVVEILYENDDMEEFHHVFEIEELEYVYLGDGQFYIYVDNDEVIKVKLFTSFDMASKYNFDNSMTYIEYEGMHFNSDESNSYIGKSIFKINFDEEESKYSDNNTACVYFKFIELVEKHISNFDEYTQEDLDVIFENREENFGSGSIRIMNY